jgi:glycosyltransferase involved in cell wall biosynthesis
MVYLYWTAGIVLALAWVSRIVDAALGAPKIADISKSHWDRQPQSHPRVSIIVPARNEQEDIEGCLRGLLALDYENYEIVAVDDRSTDQTGEIMERVAAEPEAHGRLNVIRVSELPPGWLGKTHAMWTAGERATGDWLLFTDADVLFKTDVLRRALVYAETENADHVVVFPRMIMKRPGERMMIAFFQTLFTFGHRPWKVADPDSKDHMGVGAFNMVRHSVYDAVGTYRTLRMEVVDDMKLGKVIKNARFRQRNVFGEDLISIHWAQGAMGVVNNLTKNFFAVLSFQWWRGIVSVFGLLFLNLGPFIGVWLTHGWERAPYIVALGSMFLIYLGMSFKSSIPAYYFLLHPLSTLLFGYTLARSMFMTFWDGGVTWRGTTYPLEELRKGLV